MKKSIFVVILAGVLTSSIGMASIKNFSISPLNVRMGLYSALDNDTGYDQIYYRSLKGRGVIKLTSTASDKSLPKWGPKGVTFYFYDRVENKILTCEGKLFYYLEADDIGANDLLMGCMASDSTLDTIEGYPLTGFDAGPTDIVSYEVAEGADLTYEYDGTTHESYPVIVETDTEETIVLHDDQANLGSTNYEDGFVMYYDDEGFDDSVPGWTSSSDDDVNWNGSINCPRCDDNVAGGRPGNHDGRPDESTDEGGSTENDTDIDLDYDDSDQTQETTQSSDQTTVVGNENQNTNSSGSSVNSDTSAANEVNVHVTVEVNSTNTNTSSSDSSSDFNGTVSSSSSNEESTSSPESPDPSASVSEGTDEINPDTSVPGSGGYQMVGGGGCSLISTGNPEFHWDSICEVVLLLAGIFGIRVRAYGQSL